MLLISGGLQDPNIGCIVSTAARMGVDFRIAYAGINKISWNLGDHLLIDGREVRPTSIYQRMNVFGYDPSSDTMRVNWYQNWYGMLRAYQIGRGVRGFDADVHNAWNKGLDLIEAEKLGFRIPKTLISDHEVLEDCIYKPMQGGQHTILLKSEKDYAAGPGFAQERCPGQEYRIYLAGDDNYAFRMETDALDYREKQDVKVVEVNPGQFRETELVNRLAHRNGLHYAACDLKTDKDGRLCFLEINSAPMFSEFDRAAKGRLSESMVKWLVKSNAN